MDRRQFLALGGVSTVVLAAPRVWGWARPSLNADVLARPGLLSILDGAEGITEVGRRYRAARPEEDGREALIAALHRDLPSGPLSRSRLQEHVREDFAAGRTVQLEGWVLSVTEARQCALYSLSSSS